MTSQPRTATAQPPARAAQGALSRPLDGVLVADFSRVLAGPLATMMLADLGARVIKVERPGTGDETRTWGPPYSPTGTTYFDSVNRNKESICLDLTDDVDRAVARTLALRADVLVENFKPGGMARLGLGYADLAVENPGLIYASITGFGSAGGADLLGYDLIVQALGGLMSITGDPDGPALKVGVALVDVLAAKDAAIGILAALTARGPAGPGALLEVNLLSSLQGSLVNQAQAHLGAGLAPGRQGNAHPSIAPYGTLACSDGPLAVACGNDRQFTALVAVLGADGLASDDRFASNPARVRNRAALVAHLEERLAAAPVRVWEARLNAAGVPAGRVATIEEGLELAAALGLTPTIEVHDPAGGPACRQVRHPIRWTPPLAPRTAAPPALGADGDAIRAWLARA